MDRITHRHWLRSTAPGNPKDVKPSELPYARLVFPSGASEVQIDSAKLSRGLCRAIVDGSSASVEEEDGTVSVKAPKKSRWWSRTPSEVHLSLREDVPWEIEILGGISELHADLSRIVLRALQIVGGLSEAHVALGRPRGTATIRLVGGASELTLVRPAGVGLRLALKGGASSLALDEFAFGSVGGPVRWESNEYRDSLDRYDFELLGGASELRIARGGHSYP